MAALVPLPASRVFLSQPCLAALMPSRPRRGRPWPLSVPVAAILGCHHPITHQQ
ncbi:MAG: hypothetical protein IKO08_01935 [Bacteroidales bacterium]|nr:hypothetical protein [Bacteroidales bacterium]